MDLATDEKLHTYQTVHPYTEYAVTILPNESQLWVSTCSTNLGSCVNYHVEVFDVSSEKELADIWIGKDGIAALRVAPNGSTVYCLHTYGLSSTGGVTAIDVASFRLGATFHAPHGLAPSSLVISADSTTGYVLAVDPNNFHGSALYAVDLTQMALKSTIAGVSGGSGEVAISGNGATLAVWLSEGVNEVILIDTATETITQTIPGVLGNLIGISPDGNTVYVSLLYSLQTVDAKTGNITTQFSGVPVYGGSLSQDGKVIYLFLNSGSGVIAFQEGSRISKALELQQSSAWLAVSPHGGTVYTANHSGGVSAVSMQTGAVSQLLPGLGVEAVAVSPDGGRLYAFSAGFAFTIVNAASGAAENTITLPSCTDVTSGSIAMDPTGSWAFVTESPCGSVVPINLKIEKAETPLSGTSGTGLAVSPDGTRLYASAGGSVDAIDLATKKVIGTIPVTATAIVVSPDGSLAYISGTQNGTAGVAVVDTSTLAVSHFIPVANAGGGGESIGITQDGSYVYVGVTSTTGNQVTQTVAVINTQTLQVVGNVLSGPPFVIH